MSMPFIKVYKNEDIQEDLNPRALAQGDLSRSVFEMLSDDVSYEVVTQLVEIEISPNEWLCVSSNPSLFYGFEEETKEPIYCTYFKGKPYLYIPFAYVLESQTEDGEITKTQIQVSNYDFRLFSKVYDTPEALKFNLWIIREEDEAVLYNNPYLKLTTPMFTDTQIFGELSNYNKLAEQVPTERYLFSVFNALA